MTNIGLLSDTHGFIPENIFNFFKDCDEIWHAGDIGNRETLEKLTAFKPTKAVYGNIDGYDIRGSIKDELFFNCEDAKIYMNHIGGYPPKYTKDILGKLRELKPTIFVCGHSHILKVMYDAKNELLHINPGAAGKYGFHHVSTAIRFKINGANISDLDIIEVPKNNSK